MLIRTPSRIFLVSSLLPAVLLFTALGQNRERQLQDGRLWVNVSRDNKVGWVTGFMEAAALWQADTPKKDNMAADLPFDLTNGEVMESLDKFYEEPTNRRILIVFALTWVNRKATGASFQALEDYAALLRSKAPR